MLLAQLRLGRKFDLKFSESFIKISTETQMIFKQLVYRCTNNFISLHNTNRTLENKLLPNGKKKCCAESEMCLNSQPFGSKVV